MYRIVEQIPTENTIRYADPPPLDLFVNLPPTSLTLKRLRSNGIPTKLIRAIEAGTCLIDPNENVRESLDACKNLITFLFTWINNLDRSLYNDYIPVLLEISPCLVKNVLIPGVALPLSYYETMSSSIIQLTLVDSVGVLRQLPLDVYVVDNHLTRVLYILDIVNPSALCSLDTQHSVIELINAVSAQLFINDDFLSEETYKVIPLTMYKVLFCLSEATQTRDSFSALVSIHLSDLQLKLMEYVVTWSGQSIEFFSHYWVFDYLSLLVPEVRCSLAISLLPVVPSIFTDGAGPMIVAVTHRDNVVTDSVAALEHAEFEQFEYGIVVYLPDHRDGGAGGIGVAREWYHLLAKKLSDEVLQIRDDSRPTEFYISNEASLERCMFLGKFLGIALMFKAQVGITLSGCFHVLLREKPVNLSVLKATNRELYNSYRGTLDYSDENFAIAYSLQEGDVPQDSTCRRKILDDYIHGEYVNSFEEHLKSFKKGLDSILGSLYRELFFRFLDFADLPQILCGCTELSTDDLRANTVYSGVYSPDHENIILFWKCVSEMTSEERLLLFTFWTSFRRLPVSGFLEVGPLRIMQKYDAVDLLPEAQTCSLLLYLPIYSSEERMRTSLRIVAQEYICTSFGFA